MIIQTAPEGEAHFIILQTDHALVSGDFADHWGNGDFAPIEPEDAMRHVIRHHNEGWRDVDAHPLMDPQTHLPYHMSAAPIHQRVDSGYRSPDANEAYNAYSGLISSMHTWGIYHGRYGRSDLHYVDLFEGEARALLDQMLHSELERQERLKTTVRNDAELAPYASDEWIFHNYGLLEFCDRLALLIQTNHRDSIRTATFAHVPTRPGEHVTITAQHVEPGVIHLDPWPFAVREFSVSTRGRTMRPVAHPDKTDLREYLFSLPVEHQTYTFRTL